MATCTNNFTWLEGTLTHVFALSLIKNSADFFSKGFQDIAEDEQVMKFVEWPQKLDKETLNGFSGKLYTIVIDHGIGASMRTIKVLEK